MANKTDHTYVHGSTAHYCCISIKTHSDVLESGAVVNTCNGEAHGETNLF
jgi:hypothetical protein